MATHFIQVSDPRKSQVQAAMSSVDQPQKSHCWLPRSSHLGVVDTTQGMNTKKQESLRAILGASYRKYTHCMIFSHLISDPLKFFRDNFYSTLTFLFFLNFISL